MGTSEHNRLEQARTGTAAWKKWGPYLSERQWGTVREDYSESGDAWNFFTHDHARSRAYRWGEDGIAGISDDQQHLCFSLALWNGQDAILKERLFGLTNSEGNHGEDVKEYYFYLDSTPTHSYMKYLYKYPQAAYPYSDLLETNRRRNRNDMEYELLDTGVFNDNRYFDVLVEVDCRVEQSQRKTSHHAGRGASRRDRGRGDASPAGCVHAVMRRRGAAALHGERNQPRAAVRRRQQREPLRQRRHQRLCGGRPTAGGESRQAGHQGRGALPGHCRRRQDHCDSPAARQRRLEQEEPTFWQELRHTLR
jgi:hypothetical protein